MVRDIENAVRLLVEVRYLAGGAGDRGGTPRVAAIQRSVSIEKG
jgi:hypothetical protein